MAQLSVTLVENMIFEYSFKPCDNVATLLARPSERVRHLVFYTSVNKSVSYNARILDYMTGPCTTLHKSLVQPHINLRWPWVDCCPTFIPGHIGSGSCCITLVQCKRISNVPLSIYLSGRPFKITCMF